METLLVIARFLWIPALLLWFWNVWMSHRNYKKTMKDLHEAATLREEAEKEREILHLARMEYERLITETKTERYI